MQKFIFKKKKGELGPVITILWDDAISGYGSDFAKEELRKAIQSFRDFLKLIGEPIPHKKNTTGKVKIVTPDQSEGGETVTTRGLKSIFIKDSSEIHTWKCWVPFKRGKFHNLRHEVGGHGCFLALLPLTHPYHRRSLDYFNQGYIEGLAELIQTPFPTQDERQFLRKTKPFKNLREILALDWKEYEDECYAWAHLMMCYMKDHDLRALKSVTRLFFENKRKKMNNRLATFAKTHNNDFQKWLELVKNSLEKTETALPSQSSEDNKVGRISQPIFRTNLPSTQNSCVASEESPQGYKLGKMNKGVRQIRRPKVNPRKRALNFHSRTKIPAPPTKFSIVSSLGSMHPGVSKPNLNSHNTGFNPNCHPNTVAPPTKFSKAHRLEFMNPGVIPPDSTGRTYRSISKTNTFQSNPPKPLPNTTEQSTTASTSHPTASLSNEVDTTEKAKYLLKKAQELATFFNLSDERIKSAIAQSNDSKNGHSLATVKEQLAKAEVAYTALFNQPDRDGLIEASNQFYLQVNPIRKQAYSKCLSQQAGTSVFASCVQFVLRRLVEFCPSNHYDDECDDYINPITFGPLGASNTVALNSYLYPLDGIRKHFLSTQPKDLHPNELSSNRFIPTDPFTLQEAIPLEDYLYLLVELKKHGKKPLKELGIEKLGILRQIHDDYLGLCLFIVDHGGSLEYHALPLMKVLGEYTLNTQDRRSLLTGLKDTFKSLGDDNTLVDLESCVRLLLSKEASPTLSRTSFQTANAGPSKTSEVTSFQIPHDYQAGPSSFIPHNETAPANEATTAPELSKTDHDSFDKNRIASHKSDNKGKKVLRLWDLTAPQPQQPASSSSVHPVRQAQAGSADTDASSHSTKPQSSKPKSKDGRTNHFNRVYFELAPLWESRENAHLLKACGFQNAESITAMILTLDSQEEAVAAFKQNIHALFQDKELEHLYKKCSVALMLKNHSMALKELAPLKAKILGRYSSNSRKAEISRETLFQTRLEREGGFYSKLIEKTECSSPAALLCATKAVESILNHKNQKTCDAIERGKQSFTEVLSKKYNEYVKNELPPHAVLKTSEKASRGTSSSHQHASSSKNPEEEQHSSSWYHGFFSGRSTKNSDHKQTPTQNDQKRRHH